MRDVLLLQLAHGIINAFDTPARQAFVVEMVTDRNDLPNAIALNSSMVNASRVIGPSVGGIIIAAVGEAWCYFLDGVSYIAVIASLVAMRVTPRVLPTTKTALTEELRAGFRYVTGFPPVRSALLLLALVSMMGMPYSVLMPASASRATSGSLPNVRDSVRTSGQSMWSEASSRGEQEAKRDEPQRTWQDRSRGETTRLTRS